MAKPFSEGPRNPHPRTPQLASSHPATRILAPRNTNPRTPHRFLSIYSNLTSTTMISDLPAVLTGGPQSRSPLVTKKWVSLTCLWPQLSS